LYYITKKYNLFDDDLLQQEDIKQYKNCTCCVCLENISQIKFLPCEHKICCKDCSTELILPYNRCPICRHKIYNREALTIEDLQKMEESTYLQ
jgi:hypothetical protein